MTPKQVLEYRQEEQRRDGGLPFTDWPGSWQHCSYPISELDEATFEDGFGFDGSSIRGWQAINESDMLMIPDPTTAFIDPFIAAPDAVADLRHRRSDHARALLARSALHRQEGRGVPEADRHRATPSTSVPRPSSSSSTARASSTGPNHGFYHIDSTEGVWNTGREEGGANLALQDAATRRATSRCRRPTRSRTCAPRWC